MFYYNPHQSQIAKTFFVSEDVTLEQESQKRPKVSNQDSISSFTFHIQAGIEANRGSYWPDTKAIIDLGIPTILPSST